MLGQIGCDGNGKLNAKSVLLVGDREHSGGAQVPLDLSELPEYSLFPGQVRLWGVPLPSLPLFPNSHSFPPFWCPAGGGAGRHQQHGQEDGGVQAL